MRGGQLDAEVRRADEGVYTGKISVEETRVSGEEDRRERKMESLLRLDSDKLSGGRSIGGGTDSRRKKKR